MNEKQSIPSVKKRYRKYSDEDKRNYYKAFKKSGMNPIDFCKAHGISKSALYQWTNKFKKDNHDSDFSPLRFKNNPPNLSEKQTDVAQLTVVFRDNPMQLSVSIPVHRLASFIQEIGDATTVIR